MAIQLRIAMEAVRTMADKWTSRHSGPPVRATVRWIGSLDVDVETWEPETSAWEVPLRILAGPADGPGEESFDLTVCNVAHLSTLIDRDGVVDGRHHLFVDGFNWPLIRDNIVRRVELCRGTSWNAVADKLSRLGHSEFEDYQL